VSSRLEQKGREEGDVAVTRVSQPFEVILRTSEADQPSEFLCLVNRKRQVVAVDNRPTAQCVRRPRIDSTRSHNQLDASLPEKRGNRDQPRKVTARAAWTNIIKDDASTP
jgi:hypothetical protein